MRWEVKGADRQTGEDRQIFVEAGDEAQATRRAGRQGLLVESARPLDSNDSMAGGSPQVVQAAVAPPPQLPYAQPVYIMQQAAPQPLWNPGIAALLSFIIPGAGQMYKGQVLNGLAWFAMVVVGYFFICIPGFVLHLLCVGSAAMGDAMKREKNDLVGNIVVLTIGGLFLMGIITYSMTSKPSASRPAASQTPASPQPPGVKIEPAPINIMAAQLMNEYESNELAADHQYKGKILVVRGKVGRIGKAIGDGYITLVDESGTSSRNVICMMKNNDDLIPLKPGQQVVIRGTCQGKTENFMSSSIAMMDCEIP